MASNIELIKILRERTGAGMMDCKRALDETNNDVDKATDWLREKGIAKQAKKADRIAAEGLALIEKCCCGAACVCEVNCETDFVANSDPFKALVSECCKKALSTKPADVAALSEAVKTEFTDAAVKLGEKLTIRRFDIVYTNEGEGLGTYIHQGGKIAVIVRLEKDNPELAKGLAMQIAANSPKYVLESDIPASVIEAETKIQLEASKNDPKLANKPEAALANIVKGKVHKILSESVLAEQDYLLDPSKKVGDVLKAADNKVLQFIRYQVGEGLEKRHDDFAKEVMAQVK
ncbi:MAG: translation elongation factor Ts [Candidatus Onthovivens sp.]|nr:translation elongation factor Ts [Mollicutes bacterium]MDD7546624.1 translation elongation factor Ts [Bacilli bacterium]MDY2724778.1 translation elongation factor Ts [Candidatus Onthovivens sp.]MCI6614463.1 translation elongation factor Ts [Mollicutes bacterium]MCI7040444.1 translation elongation factor Ts [Mollicutes bacterium]